MKITQKVQEIAKSKNMSLEELHTWILKETRGKKCCTDKACVGKEYQIENVVFNCMGHCYQVNLYAKFENEDQYELINSICDH